MRAQENVVVRDLACRLSSFDLNPRDSGPPGFNVHSCLDVYTLGETEFPKIALQSTALLSMKH
jgi:hypothetical protein